MASLQQIISDAERLANRLKDRQALADNILVEADSVNNQLESMRQVCTEIDIGLSWLCEPAVILTCY